LIDSNGAGGAAILDAAEEHFGIRRDASAPAAACRRHRSRDRDGRVRQHVNRAHTPQEVTAFLDRYLAHLQRRSASGRLQRLHAAGRRVAARSPACTESAAHLGLLTGNVRRGAVIKLSRHGIYEHFIDGGFGSDHHDRNQLGPVALQRMQNATGTRYDNADVIVIGDTPKDIRCAEAFGAKCLAVATGQYSRR
jgi:phosphoglycolate phosphatase